MLYTVGPSKSYDYLFNVGEIIITFTAQNGRLLQIEEKVNLALLIDK